MLQTQITDTCSLERMDSDRVQPPAVEIASPLSLANLLKAFRRRWTLALSVGLALFALCAGAVGYFVPAKYTAYALLEIRESESKPLIPESRTSSNSAERSLENAPAVVIKSRPILLAALKRPDVAGLNIVRDREDPVAWLEENLKVAFLGDSDILRVSLDGTEPKEQAVLVNAVNDAYLEEFNGQRKTKPPLVREGSERSKAKLQSNKQRASVLNPAEVPTNKNMLEKARLVGFVGALGLLFGLFGVCYFEARSYRVRSRGDKEQQEKPTEEGGASTAKRPVRRRCCSATVAGGSGVSLGSPAEVQGLPAAAPSRRIGMVASPTSDLALKRSNRMHIDQGRLGKRNTRYAKICSMS